METSQLILILILGAAHCASAQNMPQGAPQDPIATALDKNQDQKLSTSEIKGAIKALLKLDKNHDDSLSKEEISPEPPKAKSRGKRNKEAQPMPPPASSKLLTALDTDSSGDLSKAEVAAALKSLMTLDVDGDGKLSAEETGITKPSGPPGGGGAPNGGGGAPNGGGLPPHGPGGPPPGGGR